MPTARRVCLIDISNIFRMQWHGSEGEDVTSAQQKTVQAVVSYAHGFDAVAVCTDTPPYRRKKIDPGYKAHREKAPEVMHEQMRKTKERLEADGYWVVGAEGYEADDIIATITESLDCDVTIVSADKDLMQLVSDRVRVISPATRQTYGPAEVEAKFGVGPDRIADLLALTGDKSDGIAGIKGVGVKTAAKWLIEYGDLEGVCENARRLGRFAEAVNEGSEVLGRYLQLVTLETDAPINPQEIWMEREQQKLVESSDDEAIDGEIEEPEKKPTSLTVVEPQSAVEWERQLEPSNMSQAWGLAKTIHNSRMFGQFPNPESVLAIIMTGRSMGLDAVTSLRGFDSIKGRVAPKAVTLIGQVKKSKTCRYFKLLESTPDRAAWETHRVGDPEPTRLEYTIQEAGLAQLTGNDNWKKRPKTMLRWRCGVELARAVYPDVVAGLYSADEVEDFENVA